MCEGNDLIQKVYFKFDSCILLSRNWWTPIRRWKWPDRPDHMQTSWGATWSLRSHPTSDGDTVDSAPHGIWDYHRKKEWPILPCKLSWTRFCNNPVCQSFQCSIAVFKSCLLRTLDWRSLLQPPDRQKGLWHGRSVYLQTGRRSHYWSG